MVFAMDQMELEDLGPIWAMKMILEETVIQSLKPPLMLPPPPPPPPPLPLTMGPPQH